MLDPLGLLDHSRRRWTPTFGRLAWWVKKPAHRNRWTSRAARDSSTLSLRTLAARRTGRHANHPAGRCRSPHRAVPQRGWADHAPGVSIQSPQARPRLFGVQSSGLPFAAECRVHNETPEIFVTCVTEPESPLQQDALWFQLDEQGIVVSANGPLPNVEGVVIHRRVWLDRWHVRLECQSPPSSLSIRRTHEGGGPVAVPGPADAFGLNDPRLKLSIGARGIPMGPISKSRRFDSVTKLPAKRNGEGPVVIAVQQGRAVPVPKLQLALDVPAHPDFKRLVQAGHVSGAHPDKNALS